MKEDREDTWAARTETDSPHTRSESRSLTLREMLSDARDKSRGQGMVQGSTIFFKNLAESVGHSNRNLKIGLIFLTVAFVIVAGSLGYLVVKSFQSQQATSRTIEAKLKGAGADTQKQLQAVIESMRALEDRMKQLEDENRRAIDAIRASSAQDVAAARADAKTALKELEAVQKSANELRTWVDNFNKVYAHDRDLIVERIGGLSATKK